jgi:hypothetical protein
MTLTVKQGGFLSPRHGIDDTARNTRKAYPVGFLAVHRLGSRLCSFSAAEDGRKNDARIPGQ